MEKLFSQPEAINIKTDTLVVLQTISFLNHKYGLNYLVQILRGLENFGFREQEHASLVTFGAFRNETVNRVRNLIHFLIKHHFLQITHAKFGSIGLTTLGENFLRHPYDLIVNARQLKTSKYDRLLEEKLRAIRKKLSDGRT